MTEVSFSQRTIDAARDFLRSAVVVDDQPYLEPSHSPAPPSGAADPTIAEIPVAEPPSPEDDELAGRLDVEAVVRAFGSLGIVCAVIKPAQNDDAPDQVLLNAAAGADVVVLDWELYRDDGARATDLIRSLATRPVRGWVVIAIYTKSERLGQIAERVESVVREVCGDADRQGLAIRGSGIAIHVLAKPTAERSQVTSETPIVTSEELPTRLVEMFAEAAGGLLSNAALRGLTALRDGALVVLRAFEGGVDPGFVAHRLLLPRPSDAEDQAVALLAAEFAAMLESAGIEAEVNSAAISAWLDARDIKSDSEITPALWDAVFTPSASSGRFAAVASALEHGVNAVSVNGHEVELRKVGFKSVARLFCASPADGASANTRFAHLMSIESRYRADPPALGLGTICEGDGRVWVSLQPACDSVRLREPAGFPLVPLREMTETDQFALVIIDRATPRYFRPPTKFRDVQVRTFSPDADRGEVLARTAEEGWFFSDQEDRLYRWLANLREHHAQRLAKRFADRLSRLGLEESEWLRLSTPPSGDEG